MKLPSGAAAVCAVLALTLASGARAAPPQNDSFATPQELSGESGSLLTTNADATVELGEPFHAGLIGGASVWFRWVAPFTGLVRLDTCGSSFDTGLAAYVGPTVSTLALVRASDDACGAQSALTMSVFAGTDYRIAVDGGGGATGTVMLRWTRLYAPTNDTYAAAQRLEGASGTVSGTNLGATLESEEPADHRRLGGASVWYAWTAPATGTVEFAACASSFDTLLSAYTGTGLADSVVVARNDDACGDDEDESRSRVRFLVEAGTTYHVAVDGFRAAMGDVVVSWAVTDRPANDDIEAATVIAGARGSADATNVGGTVEPNEPAHGDVRGGASVWFRWTAPRTGRVGFMACAGGDLEPVVAVYSGSTLGDLRSVAAGGGRCPDGIAVLDARRGTVYSIAVDGYRASTGPFRLAWGPPPKSAQPCYVPDVRGMTVAEARHAITRRGCRIGHVSRSASVLVPRGRVMAQAPSGDKRVNAGTRVKLEVSRGSGR